MTDKSQLETREDRDKETLRVGREACMGGIESKAKGDNEYSDRDYIDTKAHSDRCSPS